MTRTTSKVIRAVVVAALLAWSGQVISQCGVGASGDRSCVMPSSGERPDETASHAIPPAMPRRFAAAATQRHIRSRAGVAVDVVAQVQDSSPPTSGHHRRLSELASAIGRSERGTVCEIAGGGAKDASAVASKAFKMANVDGAFGDEGGIDWSENQMNLRACDGSDVLRVTTRAELKKIASRSDRTEEGDGAGGLLFTEEYVLKKDPGSKQICFQGDYSDIRLKVRGISGTAEEPLVLRFDGSVFAGVDIAASHAIVDGLHAKASGRNADSAVRGSHVTINNSLFEDSRRRLLKITGNDITIQNSVLRETAPAPNADPHCIIVTGKQANRFTLKNNRIYDCGGDGLQVSPGYDGRKSMTIVDNTFYLSERYTLPTGHSCGENAVDLKGGSGTLTDNLMANFHTNEPSCSGSGSGGLAIVTHLYAHDWSISGNVISDVASCVPGNREVTGRTTKPETIEMNKKGNKPKATYNIRHENNVCNNVSGKNTNKRLRRARLGFDTNVVALPGELATILMEMAKTDKRLRCKPM